MTADFHNSQRVRITEPTHPMFGRAAIVTRLRIKDNGAWCAVFGEITPEQHAAKFDDESVFPFPQSDDRGSHTLLYPGEVEPVQGGAA